MRRYSVRVPGRMSCSARHFFDLFKVDCLSLMVTATIGSSNFFIFTYPCDIIMVQFKLFGFDKFACTNRPMVLIVHQKLL